jgi:AbrB family looped-hinge helix DNA binding protein
MELAYSRLTAQGQISVPSEVRRRLGLGPGSTITWETDGERIVVRRLGTYSSEDIHQALFAGKKPKAKSLDNLKEGIRESIRKRHARD